MTLNILMVDTKPLSQVQKKWEDSIGRVPGAYTEGVAGAKDVIAKGVAAESLYAEKLQATIASKKRATELSKVSDSEWKAAATDKGAKRIGAGMTGAKGKFNKGISEVLTVIQGVTIAPRTADPLANVDNRVKPIVKALADMKK
jgi:hypothetical protein